MLQELIDAVNAYRLKHSESEAIGGRGVEGLNDAYANMLAVCDAAEQSVQQIGDTCGYIHSALTDEWNYCPGCGVQLANHRNGEK